MYGLVELGSAHHLSLSAKCNQSNPTVLTVDIYCPRIISNQLLKKTISAVCFDLILCLFDKLKKLVPACEYWVQVNVSVPNHK
jgi:hypothetical protein